MYPPTPQQQHAQDYASEPPAHPIGGADIVGTLQRQQESPDTFRYVEYYGTFALSFGSSTTFTPTLGLTPDYWRMIIAPGDGGNIITVTQDGGDALPIPIGQVSTVLGPVPTITLTFPGRPNSRSLTLANGGAGGNGIRFVLAAVWGYNPEDIF